MTQYADDPKAGEGVRRTSQLILPPGLITEPWDADCPLGWDDAERTISIPMPGTGGRHLLMGGATGAGKSECLNGLFTLWARREHVAILGVDPKRVELTQWTPRASTIAKGRDVAAKALRRLIRELSYRMDWCDRNKLQEIPVADPDWLDERSGLPWPFILAVFDELADLGRGTSKQAAARMDLLEEAITLGRAAAIGLVLCTQTPDTDAVPARIRNNARVRLAFGCESFQQSDQILGQRAPGMDPHLLDESTPGAAILKLTRRYHRIRTYRVPPGSTRHVAEQYAALRVDLSHLGWEHVMADPLPMPTDEED